MSRDHFGTYITDSDYEAATQRGITRKAVQWRVGLGWSAKRAISEPPHHPSRRCPEYQKFLEIALDNGISASTFRSRVNKYKWTLDEAATTPILSKAECSKRGNAAYSAKRGIPEGLLKMARENGIKKGTFYSRLAGFWNPIDAATKPKCKIGGGEHWQRLNRLTFNNTPQGGRKTHTSDFGIEVMPT